MTFFSQNSFIYNFISLGWIITFIPLSFSSIQKSCSLTIDLSPLAVVADVSLSSDVVEIYVFNMMHMYRPSAMFSRLSIITFYASHRSDVQLVLLTRLLLLLLMFFSRSLRIVALAPVPSLSSSLILLFIAQNVIIP